MKREGALIVDDGVPGIVTALEADDHFRVLGESVNNLALAFVAPLGAKDGDGAHDSHLRGGVTAWNRMGLCISGFGAVR